MSEHDPVLVPGSRPPSLVPRPTLAYVSPVEDAAPETLSGQLEANCHLSGNISLSENLQTCSEGTREEKKPVWVDKQTKADSSVLRPPSSARPADR